MDTTTFQWTVVGAGPAGIAAVGQLLDEGVRHEDILWLDPYFKVGDLGRYWSNISSNTKVKSFVNFLDAVRSFSYNSAPIDFKINHLPQQDTCMLQCIVEPLLWVSDRLCTLVHTEKTMVHRLNLSQNQWTLQTDTNTYHSKNVILATGAEPEYLQHPNIETIPFETAIDIDQLKNKVSSNDTIAVFGSSHSAIIILKYLTELGVKKIITIYYLNQQNYNYFLKLNPL